MYSLSRPTANEFWIKIGWWLTPWRSLPPTIDVRIFDYPGFSEGLGALLAFGAFLSVLVMLMHGVAFAAASFLYKWRAWPPYWPDVVESVEHSRLLWSAWAESAWRACWVFPSAMTLSGVWGKLAWTMMSAGYPLIGISWQYPLATFVAILLTHGFISSLVLRRYVTRLVPADGHRCVACGYLLRGLSEPRCPECGLETRLCQKPGFHLLGRRSEQIRRASVFIQFVLPFMLVFAPLWIPLLAKQILSIAGRPTVPVGAPRVAPNPDAFPVDVGAVCFVRRNGEVSAVRVSKDPQNQWRYESRYWADEAAFGHDPPSATNTGPLSPPSWSSLTAGPWTLHFSDGSDTMGYLYRPDVTYQVEVHEADDERAKLAFP